MVFMKHIPIFIILLNSERYFILDINTYYKFMLYNIVC